MHNFRRTIMRVLVATTLAILSGAAPAQQAFPNRPIRFITPYAPGGGTTIMARLVAQHLTERWGQNVIVDNRPGGNTVIGTELLAKSPPDGYTILLTSSTHSIISSLIKTPYDPIRDFAPIASIGIAPHLLVLHPGVPANTVQELIALAKSKPGHLTFASASTGGTTHMAAEMFNLLAGVETRHIPYKGGGPAAIDLIGGHVQMFFATPITVFGHVQSGKLKPVAVTGQLRLTAFPQTPTFAEAGLAGFDVKTWNGVTAPAGTSRAIIDKYSKEIGAILSSPGVREKLDAMGLTALISTPEQFGAMIASEIGMYLKVIRATNIRID